MALGTLLKSVFEPPPQRADEVNESVKDVSASLLQGFRGMYSDCDELD